MFLACSSHGALCSLSEGILGLVLETVLVGSYEQKESHHNLLMKMVRLIDKPVTGDWAKNVLALKGAYADVVCADMFRQSPLYNGIYPPASEVSREVANLTERKNPHTPVHGVKEFVCLSVCYQIRPQLSQDWQKRMGWNIFRTSIDLSSYQNQKP